MTFCVWGNKTQQIQFVLYNNDNVLNAKTQLEQFICTPICSTAKIHVVKAGTEGTIFVRDTSCFCDNCSFDNASDVPCNGGLNMYLEP